MMMMMMIRGGEEVCGSCAGDGLDVVLGEHVTTTTQERFGEMREVEAGGRAAQAEGGRVEGAGGL